MNLTFKTNDLKMTRQQLITVLMCCGPLLKDFILKNKLTDELYKLLFTALEALLNIDFLLYILQVKNDITEKAGSDIYHPPEWRPEYLIEHITSTWNFCLEKIQADEEWCFFSEDELDLFRERILTTYTVLMDRKSIIENG